MLDIQAPDVDSARMRTAGRDLLSLALIDARNHTLRWAGAYERALEATGRGVPIDAELNPPLWELGHVGWFQESWIGRNMQRARGEACDAIATRLASILPNADGWYDPGYVRHADRWQLELPDLAGTKQYLVDTLETTLELLESTPETDDGLYFFRLALFHEDLHCESLATMSQTLGFDAGLLPALAALNPRPPVLLPATRWRLGSAAGGFAFDNERAAHEVAVPEFEIDAQPVVWEQYAEFVEDGGYDERAHWSEAGWQWLQADGRRVPRHVDQMRNGVLQQRFGKLMRVPMTQPVCHVSGYEAEAWCRWAGRRLPTEVEWEAAAHQAASRGFRWGDVWEWTSTTFRAYPGFVASPWRDLSLPAFGRTKVLRGASFATRARMRSPRFRHFAAPDRDDGFFGFRSCAL